MQETWGHEIYTTGYGKASLFQPWWSVRCAIPTFDVNQCSLRGSTFCFCLLRLGLAVTGAPAEHFGTRIHGVGKPGWIINIAMTSKWFRHHFIDPKHIKCSKERFIRTSFHCSSWQFQTISIYFRVLFLYCFALPYEEVRKMKLFHTHCLDLKNKININRHNSYVTCTQN